MTLIRCKALKPFVLFGRYVITHERLNLHVDDFETLLASGHVECVGDDAPINGHAIDVGPWVRPVTR